MSGAASQRDAKHTPNKGRAIEQGELAGRALHKKVHWRLTATSLTCTLHLPLRKKLGDRLPNDSAPGNRVAVSGVNLRPTRLTQLGPIDSGGTVSHPEPPTPARLPVGYSHRARIHELLQMSPVTAGFRDRNREAVDT